MAENPGVGHDRRRRVVVLGAGIGGLSAAWVLARAGHEVTVLDRDDHVGGLAVTKRREGFEYDLGPHNIHTTKEHVLAFLRRHLGDSLFEHHPRAKIVKRGRLIDYPLRGAKVLSSLPPWRIPIAGTSFVAARARMFLREPASDASFEEWIRNRFGDVLYGEYFGPYAEKVWGIRGREIDRYVADKRVPIVSLTELIKAALFGKTAGANHPEFLDHNYYLRHGIGETVAFFERELAALGVRVALSAEVRGVIADGDVVRAVEVTAGGATERLEAEHVLSTIPLNALVPLVTGAPASALDAARGLDYCASVLLFVRLAHPGRMPSAMVYFSDPAVRFSRVYDVGMYSRAMVPEGKSMLCLELPCTAGDAAWRTDERALQDEALAALSAAGLARSEDLEGVHVERVSHSYPRFRQGFQERVRACQEFLARHRNLISYGRQGSFAYLNVDGVMHQGFMAAAAVLAADSTACTDWEWFQAR